MRNIPTFENFVNQSMVNEALAAASPSKLTVREPLTRAVQLKLIDDARKGILKMMKASDGESHFWNPKTKEYVAFTKTYNGKGEYWHSADIDGGGNLMESALNEGKSDAFPTYNNGYAPGDYKYMKEMKSLLSKVEGISPYDDMDTTTDVYIKSSPNNSKTDLTRDIQKVLKGFDDNLDLDNITSNIGNPRLISPNDQQKGIVTYKVPKKVEWWTLKRAAGDKPSTETQITPDIVFSLLDRMAQVSTTQHELADINWTSLNSFLDAAEDHMKPAQYTKFVKEIRKKYPKMK